MSTDSDVRGGIERVFGTFNTDLFQEANGRVFSNPAERGDFDSEGTATLTDDMLAMMLVRYVVDVYHNRPHEGLLGETPNDAWDRLSRRYPMCPPPLPKDRRAIFGLNVRRKVRGNGVLVCGIQYRCDQLDQLFLRRPDDEHSVKVRINPENIGTVDVLIDGQWYPARAVGGGFDGIRMDLWIAKIRAIRQTNHEKSLLKRHVVLAALADIRAMNNEPYLLLDMTPFGCTAKQINHAEKSVFLGLEAEALSSAELEKHFIATSFEVSPVVPEAAVPETFEPETHKADVLSIVSHYASVVDIKLHPDLRKVSFVRRLLHASSGDFGKTVQEIIRGLTVSIENQSKEVTIADFAAGFHEKYKLVDAANPYLVPDYLNIVVPSSGANNNISEKGEQ